MWEEIRNPTPLGSREEDSCKKCSLFYALKDPRGYHPGPDPWSTALIV